MHSFGCCCLFYHRDIGNVSSYAHSLRVGTGAVDDAQLISAIEHFQVLQRNTVLQHVLSRCVHYCYNCLGEALDGRLLIMTLIIICLIIVFRHYRFHDRRLRTALARWRRGIHNADTEQNFAVLQGTELPCALPSHFRPFAPVLAVW